MVAAEIAASARDGRTDMVADGLGHMPALMALQPKAKAQVHVFKITKKIFIQPPHRLPGTAPVECGGGAGGEDFPLPACALRTQTAMVAAKGPARPVVAVARTIEHCSICCVEQGTPKCSPCGVPGGSGEELLEPVRRGEGVRIEQGHPGRVRLGNGQVVGARKALVGPQAHQAETRVLKGGHQLGRAVGAAVVHDQRPERAHGLLLQGPQALRQVLQPVPVHDDDRHPRRISAHRPHSPHRLSPPCGIGGREIHTKRLLLPPAAAAAARRASARAPQVRPAPGRWPGPRPQNRLQAGPGQRLSLP